MSEVEKVTDECECMTFDAHQQCYHDVTVDINNHFMDNMGIYQADSPYGPYTCIDCGKEYNELPQK